MKIRVSVRAAFLILALTLVGPRSLLGPGRLLGQERARPTLIVALVVDQLRADLLDRYDQVWTGGFRRILDQGYRFTQASHAHARTSTAPGHATISTGVFPSRHAVVANSWQQRVGNEWRPTYAVADPASPILGFENEPALEGRSPRTMLREGLADWVLSADAGARVVAISKKDRAAIPLGGQHAEHVYWMVPEIGRFVTSHYYMDRYPDWLGEFNDEVMPGISAEDVWNTGVPAELRALARADSASYEGDGIHTVFPHVSQDENPPGSVQAHNFWAYDQPRADDAVIRLAYAAMDELELGRRAEQDLLAISLSATDRVGHPYGPLSQEQLSNLIHLDRLLGEFLEHLDETVGQGNWVLGLTADHGVLTMPEAQVELGINPSAKRIPMDERNAELSSALRVAASEGGSPEHVAQRLAELVEQRGLAAKAYTHHDLTRGVPADSFAVLFRNSHYPGRAWGPLSRWGVEVRFGEGDLVGFRTGTNHESTYWYDRHVPLVFVGAGVEAGRSDEAVYSVDFAPTLAGLAGIPVPDDLDGRLIY